MKDPYRCSKNTKSETKRAHESVYLTDPPAVSLASSLIIR